MVGTASKLTWRISIFQPTAGLNIFEPMCTQQTQRTTHCQHCPCYCSGTSCVRRSFKRVVMSPWPCKPPHACSVQDLKEAGMSASCGEVKPKGSARLHIAGCVPRELRNPSHFVATEVSVAATRLPSPTHFPQSRCLSQKNPCQSKPWFWGRKTQLSSNTQPPPCKEMTSWGKGAPGGSAWTNREIRWDDFLCCVPVLCVSDRSISDVQQCGQWLIHWPGGHWSSWGPCCWGLWVECKSLLFCQLKHHCLQRDCGFISKTWC